MYRRDIEFMIAVDLWIYVAELYAIFYICKDCLIDNILDIDIYRDILSYCFVYRY